MASVGSGWDRAPAKRVTSWSSSLPEASGLPIHSGVFPSKGRCRSLGGNGYGSGVTASGNAPIIAFLLILFAVASAYAAGRLHQWYRQALERDDAWRDGYDKATGSLFKLLTRAYRNRAVGETSRDLRVVPGEVSQEIPTPTAAEAGVDTKAAATVTSISNAPSSVARHSKENREAQTRRIVPPARAQ